jgi:hypothetical protein
MAKTHLSLNNKAVAEANAVAEPFLKAHKEALLALDQAGSAYREVWQHAYAQAMKAPRNN